MSSGATNALVSMVTGNRSIHSTPTDSGLGASRPSQMPTHRKAKRSSSSSPMAASASAGRPVPRPADNEAHADGDGQADAPS